MITPTNNSGGKGNIQYVLDYVEMSEQSEHKHIMDRYQPCECYNFFLYEQKDK